MSRRNKGTKNLKAPALLRLWPGVAAVTVQWLGMFGVPFVLPEAAALGVIGGLLGGVVVFLWWPFFSRAPRLARWGAVVLVVVAMFATPRLLHESVATRS
jgi:hypothetical protein